MRDTRFPCLCGIAASTLLFATTPAIAGEAPADRLKALVDAAVQPVMKANDIPGLAVAISLKENRITSGYGLASKGRPPGDAGDPVREIGSVSDLHRHPSRLCPSPRQDAPRRPRQPALAALQSSRFDGISLLDLATYTAGGLPHQFPTRCRRTRHRSATLPPVAADLRAGQPAPLFQPEHRPVQLSRQLAWASRSNDLSSKCSRHWASNRPTSTCPRRRWRSTPRATARTDRYGSVRPPGCRRLRQKTSAPTCCASSIPPASGAPGQALGAGARCHPSRLPKVGDMTRGLGWEAYDWPISLKRLQGGNSTPMALQPQDRRAARATGRWRASAC